MTRHIIRRLLLIIPTAFVALRQRDLPVLMGLTLAVVIVYAVVNLIVGISYAWFDPRIRYGKAESS